MMRQFYHLSGLTIGVRIYSPATRPEEAAANRSFSRAICISHWLWMDVQSSLDCVSMFQIQWADASKAVLGRAPEPGQTASFITRAGGWHRPSYCWWQVSIMSVNTLQPTCWGRFPVTMRLCMYGWIRGHACVV